jgi:small nuclear ribonucleoprotein E
MDRRGGGQGRKTLLAPIHFIFKLLQQRSTVSIWLYEQTAVRIEGKIRVHAPPVLNQLEAHGWHEQLQGFDEFMNLVIDDAVEVQQPMKGGKEEKRRQLGNVKRYDVDGKCWFGHRTNLAERRQCVTYSSVAISTTLKGMRIKDTG